MGTALMVERPNEIVMNAPKWLIDNKVTVPTGTIGRACIERYTVTPDAADGINWKSVMNDDDRAFSYPGEYTGLVVDGIMVMSDIASEICDHLPFIKDATGRVLLTGLGIGMCLQALLRKPDVEHVTVVEKSTDVIALVAGHYIAMFGSERAYFICADAFEWQPPRGIHFDMAFHDIWPLAMGAYWPEHVRLLDRYCHVAREQDSWRGEWMRGKWEAEREKV